MRRPRISSRLTASLACLALAACGTETGSEMDAAGGNPATGADPTPADVLFSESPPEWFEAYFTWLHVSPDGRRAVFDYRRLVDLANGEELEMPGDLDAVFRARFDPDGTLMLAGRRGDEEGWFRAEPDGAGADAVSLDSTLPPRYVLEPSPSGDRFAYWLNDDPGTLLTVARAEPGAPDPTPSPIPVPGRLVGIAWLPDGSGLVACTVDEAGIGTLHMVDLMAGYATTVAAGLDAVGNGTRIAVSPDGASVYMALAGPDAPDPDARHVPGADRDLDIWAIDLATGRRNPAARGPGEQLVPNLANGTLHWVSIVTRSEAVLLPLAGGSADGGGEVEAAQAGADGGTPTAGPLQVVTTGVQIPTWRPDGAALGLTTGDWRLADWALNLDGGVIEVYENGRPAGAVEPIITGYHEDFSPVWSPDGRWIAYHSHRSAAPVAGYSAEGSSDDIYLRRVDDPDAEEIRLTDFGWEVGNPDWAPDGGRLVMTTWEEGGGTSAWVVDLDPETGAFLGRSRVSRPEGAAGEPAWAAWSPVAEELAITFAAPSRTELWVMAPDGSGARRIADWTGGRYGGLDWSADGEWIVYAAPVDGRFRLYGVSREGGEPWLLAEDEANLLHPQISPDGHWVAASRMEHERRIMRAR